MVGAAIVAAELRADDNKIRERLVWGFVGKVDPQTRMGVLPRFCGLNDSRRSDIVGWGLVHAHRALRIPKFCSTEYHL